MMEQFLCNTNFVGAQDTMTMEKQMGNDRDILVNGEVKKGKCWKMTYCHQQNLSDRAFARKQRKQDQMTKLYNSVHPGDSS